ncbi:MAG: hypothetical protein IJ729_04510 [Alloprevotella sp.]|nr:hypothetical protein [Alloprevotella sp.]
MDQRKFLQRIFPKIRSAAQQKPAQQQDAAELPHDARGEDTMMQEQHTSQSTEASESAHYAANRKAMKYYEYLRSVLLMLSRPEDTILDVGSRGVDMMTFLPCKKKISIDLEIPLQAEGVEGIAGDYLTHRFEGLDIITCFQVLEHLDDETVALFAKKLQEEARIAIVTVPYMWRQGQDPKIKHVQDPVSVDKLIGWFGKNPVHLHLIMEKNGSARLLAVFVKDINPEINLNFWRKIETNIAAMDRKRPNGPQE